jgi:hypothetical protein
MSQNGNPLIGANKGDTIDGAYEFLEWMLIQAGQDGVTHPGMIAQLRLLFGALGSLKTEVDGEKIKQI